MASSASSDEGEIRDVGAGGAVKANTSLPQLDGTSVDRQDRTRSRSSRSRSPYYESGSGSQRRPDQDRNNPSYSDRDYRGSKRTRDDDHYDARDPRRFKVHYEDRPRDSRRRPISYEDLDTGSTSAPDLRYDDNDSRREKRHRTRSRSPYRYPQSSDRRPRDGHESQDRGRYDSKYTTDNRGRGYEEQRSRVEKDQSVSKRANGSLRADLLDRNAKSAQGSSQQHNATGGSHQDSKHPTAENATDVPEETEQLDEAALIELRRKRREAIKAKYKGAATPLLVQALHINDESRSATPAQNNSAEDSVQSTREGSPVVSAPGTPREADPASPAEFAITDDRDLANKNSNLVESVEEDGPSAADYDPTMDMREDRQRDDERHHEDMVSKSYHEIPLTSHQDVLLPASTVTADEKPKKTKDEFDMFADEDDDDDMFAEKPDSPTRQARSLDLDEPSIAVPVPTARTLDVGMLDNWDDPEGYYKVILGELLNGRYHVQSNLGQGMFSGVVRAMDVTTKQLVAIKLIRNNDTMRKAALKEIEILQKLNESDPEDKKHIIRLIRHFEHKGHICMVFENLSINLREVLKKFGRDVGINLRAVRAYAQQMFLGLSLMRKCNILHADLKPDNILVNDSRNMLKICDLGSASDATENEITPYLVSRFYRAPEIILGMQYDFAIDVWSVGCTLYELFTGKILFTGRTNNQMLRSIMDCRGKFTTKMLKRCQFAHLHFDEMANFRSVERDQISGRDTVKTLSFVKPSRDLRSRLMAGSKGLTEGESRELGLFVDLLERCLALNPEKRCTPSEALKHPFIVRVATGGK